MTSRALISVILLVMQCEGFRTNTESGVISFNNIFSCPFPVGSSTELNGEHFRLTLQKYRTLFRLRCTILVTVFDKAYGKVVDFAKMPCDMDTSVTYEDSIHILGDLIYNPGPSELVFMMKGGGCVVRHYLKDAEGAMEIRMTTRTEDICRRIYGEEQDTKEAPEQPSGLT